MSEGKQPNITVIIPVYNAEKYLRQCLDSVLSQTMKDIEVLCIDDGSWDRSPALLAEYAEADPRVRVIRQENAGPGTARNRGLREARGKYLAFIDSDDFWEPPLLEKAYTQAEKTGADICLYSFFIYDESTASTERDIYPGWLPAAACFSPREVRDRIFQMTPSSPGFRLCRRFLIEKYGLAFLPQYLAEDMAFVYPAMAFAEKICYLTDAHAYLRRGTKGNISSALWKYPDATHNALLHIRDILQKAGVFETFRESFRTAAISASEYIFWHVPPDVLPEPERLRMLEELDIADKQSIITWHGDDPESRSFSRIRSLLHMLGTFGPSYTFRYYKQIRKNKKRP